MKSLIAPNPTILRLLPPLTAEGASLRMTGHCLEEAAEGGRLLYHTLTGELLFLAEGEVPRDYLLSHRFLVPQDYDECGAADQVRRMLRFYQQNAARGYKTYTILPTTDCNARCFYCFELGSKPQHMSPETAEAVIRFIRRTAAPGETLTLRFFGGEPLLGEAVIDRITQALTDDGTAFFSSFVTNGYLFTPEMIEKARRLWRLRDAQITLDGTEAVYNRRKAYLHDKTGAYRRVLGNIEDLLKTGVEVTARLNMDRNNFEDLMALTEELAGRFGDRPGFTVYPHMLFQDILSSDAAHQAKVYRLFGAFDGRIRALGLKPPAELPQKLQISYCIADDPQAVVILPDGRLHACEHYTENHCFGDVWENTAKQGELPFWEETFPRDEACPGCPLYPICFRVKHCPDIPERCIPQERERRIERLREACRRAAP